jgi:hypothetical protein
LSLEKLYIFLIIAVTGTVWGVLENGLILALSTIVLICLFLKDSQARFNVSLLLTYGALSCLLALILLFHFVVMPLQNDPLRYIGLYFRFILVGAFWIYLRNKKIDFCFLLQGILKWIGIHAFIGFILSFVLAKHTFHVPSDSISSNTFFFVFFYNSSFSVLGIDVYRNQGIFWEPGVLQVYMNILFFISSFINRNRKLQFFSAFLILSTYSTTGIGILVLQLLVILFAVKTTFLKKAGLFFVLTAVAVPILIINSSQKLNDNNGGTSEKTSSVLRAYDLVEGVNITRQYPLTGIGLSDKTYKAVKVAGYSSFSKYSQEMTDILLDRKSSNSISYFFVRFGIPFSLFWFFLLYRQDIFRSKKFLIFLIIILENNSEPLLIEPFFLMIAASGFYNLIKIKATPLLKYKFV